MTPQQLKNSILQQAIEGKLVEQRPEEGTAEDLYAQIQEEKKKLIEEGKIKKEKTLPKITEEEITFDIPQSWKWVRIGDLANYKKGPFGSALTKSIFVPKSDKAIKVYEQKNAIQKDANLGSYYITQEYFKEKMKSFEVVAGDIIVSCAGTIGEIYKLPTIIEKGIINQALMRIRLFEPTYCEYFELLFDYLIKDYSRKSSKGSAIKNIPPFEILKKYVIPLPPLAEQKRIVAKIEELLPFVDKYEKAYNALEEYNARFPEDMKKSILQQAIEGKLVEQRPEEGTAEELYAQIQEEKKKLIAEEKIKKEKPLPEITEDEIPFDIPESWKWVRLNEVVSKEIKRGKSPKYTAKSNTLVFAQKCNSKYEGIRTDLALYLDETTLEKYSEQEFMLDGDIVINSTGGGTMGRVGQYHIKDNKQSFPIVPDSHVTVIRSNNVNIDYLFYFLKSQQNFLEGQGDGSTNQTELKPLILKSLLLPLPPLEEQKRIVAKIEELLPYCEKLK